MDLIKTPQVKRIRKKLMLKTMITEVGITPSSLNDKLDQILVEVKVKGTRAGQPIKKPVQKLRCPVGLGLF